MPRLRVLSGREVCALLALHGFVEARRRGSHIVMQRHDERGTLTVPVPDHAELRIGPPPVRRSARFVRMLMFCLKELAR